MKTPITMMEKMPTKTTEVLENKFEIYLDGHAVDDSKTLEIIEKEIS